jgi:HNH endonuclease
MEGVFMGSYLGVEKVAAKRIGMSFEEYKAKKEAGLKWCTNCKEWHPISDFPKDSSLKMGLSCHCWRSYKNIKPDRPGTHERREKRKQGLYWCSGCKEWLERDKFGKNINGFCKEHLRQKIRERYHKNPEPAKMWSKKLKELRKPIPKYQREYLIHLFGGKCTYCGKKPKKLHFDHVIPVSLGGPTKFGNMVPVCQQCNSSKLNLDLDSWLEFKGWKKSEVLKDYLQKYASHLEQAKNNRRKINVLKGSDNPCASFAEQQVKAIRDEYQIGDTSYPKLAKKYGVCEATISRLVRRKTYG